uniref:Uncharacterized protein n=1 Tax=Steinernema glaseri TaxID=37863 RepID=A0A1I8ABY2_9BILA
MMPKTEENGDDMTWSERLDTANGMVKPKPELLSDDDEKPWSERVKRVSKPEPMSEDDDRPWSERVKKAESDDDDVTWGQKVKHKEEKK